MYQVSDLIMYGNEGVCRVEEINRPDIPGLGGDRLYYTLAPLYRQGRILTPVDSSVYMRPVINRKEALRLIRLIPDIKVDVFETKKPRELDEYYQRTLRSQDCADMIQLIKEVSLKHTIVESKGKKIGALDVRYRKRAEELLYGELAVALDMPREDVQDFVEQSVQAMETVQSGPS